MGYNPESADQWSADDLERATVAGDFTAINAARRAGQLRGILNPPQEVTDPAELEARLNPPPPPLSGPVVQAEGTGSVTPLEAPVTQADHLELAAMSPAEVLSAARAGRLTGLGIGTPTTH